MSDKAQPAVHTPERVLLVAVAVLAALEGQRLALRATVLGAHYSALALERGAVVCTVAHAMLLFVARPKHVVPARAAFEPRVGRLHFHGCGRRHVLAAGVWGGTGARLEELALGLGGELQEGELALDEA